MRERINSRYIAVFTDVEKRLSITSLRASDSESHQGPITGFIVTAMFPRVFLPKEFSGSKIA